MIQISDTPQDAARAMFHPDLLEERGALLGEPYTRQLAGETAGVAVLLRRAAGPHLLLDRPRRRIVMLTVFTKTKMRETAEIERAKQAMARCQREGHTPDEEGWR